MHTNKFHMIEAANSATRNNSLPSIPIIVSVILIFTAISCGGGTSTPPSNFPVANPGGPYVGNVNQALGFSGSGSAPSGRTIVSFGWQFGDGAVGTGATTSHTYTTAGNFTATLTVTDSSGATGSNSVAVQIFAAPVAKPGGPYVGKVGTAVAFDGSASIIPPGQVASYAWTFGDGSTSGAPVAQPQTTHIYSSPCTCTVTLTVAVGIGGSSSGTTTATISASSGASSQSATPSTFFAIGPAANASSQFAYVLSPLQTGGSSLTIDALDTTSGNLSRTGIAAPSLDATFAPSGMITDPSRKFLYVYGGNIALAFSIASDTGALIPSGNAATTSGSAIPGNQILVFDPSGKTAFFISQDPNTGNTNSSGSVTRFSVDPNTGALGMIETISAQVQNPLAAAIDPGGKFLFISGTITGSSADGSPGPPQIAVFSVDANTRAASPASGSPFPIQPGINPSAIAIDPTGRFIYAAGASSTNGLPALTGFSINKDTGALSGAFSPLQLSTSPANVSSIVLSPTGTFDYVLTSDVNSVNADEYFISLLKRDAQTGEPTCVRGSVAQLTPGPTKLGRIPTGNLTMFSPSQSNTADSSTNTSRGAFLFLTTSTDATVHVLLNNPGTGLFATSTQWNAQFQ
jgi:PKD repeat protein